MEGMHDGSGLGRALQHVKRFPPRNAICLALALIASACGGEIHDPDASTDASFDGSLDGRSEAGDGVHRQWLDFCIGMTSCYTGRTTDCLLLLSGWSDPEWSVRLTESFGFDVPCVADAGANCAAVYACENGGAPDQPCDAGQSCSGSVQTDCFGSHTTKRDCANTGVTTACSNGVCSLGACATSGKTCKGNRVVLCSGTANYEYLCDVYTGAVCTESGSVECIGTGPPCTDDTCNGSQLVRCFRGAQASFDCRNLGLECKTGVRVHCALGTECTAFNDSCGGTSLTFCDDGTIATVDCVARGWKSCSTDPDGGARCSP